MVVKCLTLFLCVGPLWLRDELYQLVSEHRYILWYVQMEEERAGVNGRGREGRSGKDKGRMNFQLALRREDKGSEDC